MKKFIIKIEGETLYDVEIALEEVSRVISAGYVEGFDGNEGGNYSFEKNKED